MLCCALSCFFSSPSRNNNNPLVWFRAPQTPTLTGAKLFDKSLLKPSAPSPAARALQFFIWAVNWCKMHLVDLNKTLICFQSSLAALKIFGETKPRRQQQQQRCLRGHARNHQTLRGLQDTSVALWKTQVSRLWSDVVVQQVPPLAQGFHKAIRRFVLQRRRATVEDSHAQAELFELSVLSVKHSSGL